MLRRSLGVAGLLICLFVVRPIGSEALAEDVNVAISSVGLYEIPLESRRNSAVTESLSAHRS